MFMTATLRNFLENYEKTLPLEQFAQLKWDIEAATDMYSNELAKAAPGVERGRKVHELIEQEIAKSQHIAVSCFKGCSACCHFEVEITGDDAKVLHNAVAGGVPVDRERLAKLAQRVRQGSEWKKGMVASNRCLFLGEDNACRVYDSRPAACRKLSVVSDPSECAKTDGQPLPRVIPMVEVILSAALSFSDSKYGAFAKMLNETFQPEVPVAPQITSLV